MMRFRRYRIFLIFAAVCTVLIIHITHTRSPSQIPLTKDVELNPPPLPPTDDGRRSPDPVKAAVQAELKDTVEQIQTTTLTKLAPAVSTKSVGHTTSTIAARTTSAALPDVPRVILPDRNPVPPTKVQDEASDEIHPINPPGRQEPVTLSAPATEIHWQKQPEHFPVPTESIIQLPTGKPKAIPKIQHDFNDETTDAKINREKRQVRVKAEFQRAWAGYKKFAWLHDELSPVSGKFRDPFCGWAATLVDGLDTLWIMGLQEEFEEAAHAVDLLDFTTSPRGDIPMFETTIRYLGGLLAAYDVSGSKYKNLLSKAVELADILMGAFDTPNRMPVLYYQWKPAFASQPHRAAVRSNLAELGSLSMEFTRLAQLTGEARYYDAVARITNALSEWQDRGTLLGGVFPDNVDASGCNTTKEAQQPVAQATHSPQQIINAAKVAGDPQGYKPKSPGTVAEMVPKKSSTKDATLEVEVVPGLNKAKISGWDNSEKPKEQGKSGNRKTSPPELGKAKIKGWDGSENSLPESPGKKTGAVGEKQKDPARELGKAKIGGWGDVRKRSFSDEMDHSETVTAHGAHGDSNESDPTPTYALPADDSTEDKVAAGITGWDCAPQPLIPSSQFGAQKFSMAGGQDSTYEYFPKQYMLLGGLEDKYRKMYMMTIEAVRNYMLFRPMTPENSDILFSGSVTTSGNPEVDLDLSPDVEHLTCFIGGMVGMSSRLFGIKGDIELAKKLTDGCVWAYSQTATGIMPEAAVVMPCKKADDCKWNETAYFDFLDPSGPVRDLNVANYIVNKAEAEATAVAKSDPLAEAARLAKLVPTAEVDEEKATYAEGAAAGGGAHLVPKSVNSSMHVDTKTSLRKRETRKAKEDTFKQVSHTVEKEGKLYEQKADQTESELLDIASAGRKADLIAAGRIPPPEPVVDMPDPFRPFNHTEWVANRIQQDSLPPGFTNIRSPKYILRPEAIESVWYMYRITGDKTWQDKGWVMFEAILNATSTIYGHSAVSDVTSEEKSYQIDEMESFWLAETLKYFYLLYSTPDTISLDEWVLNTEAHPFKRPT